MLIIQKYNSQVKSMVVPHSKKALGSSPLAFWGPSCALGHVFSWY